MSDVRWLETPCWYCGNPMHDGPTSGPGWTGKVHRDHWWPRSRGGSNGSHNIRLCCGGCNLLKRAGGIEEFRRRLMYLDLGIPEEAEYLKDWLVRLTGNPWPEASEFPFYGEDPKSFVDRYRAFGDKYNCWSADYQAGARHYASMPANDAA